MTYFLKKNSIVVAFALTIGACAHDYQSPQPYDQIQRGEVQMTRLPFTVSAEPDGTSTLSGVTYASIDQFLTSIDAGYGDVAFLDAGSNVSEVRLKSLETYVIRRGIEYGGKAVLGARPDNGNVVLYIERHKYEPASCGNWKTELSDNDQNNVSTYYGCATESTLGQMVADPRDLVSGRKNKTDSKAATQASSRTSSNNN